MIYPKPYSIYLKGDYECCWLREGLKGFIPLARGSARSVDRLLGSFFSYFCVGFSA